MASLFMNYGLEDVNTQRLGGGCAVDEPVFHRNCSGVTNEVMNMLGNTHLKRHCADEKMNEIEGDNSDKGLGAFCLFKYLECNAEEDNPLLWKDLAAEALKYYNKQNQGAELSLVGEVEDPPLIFEEDICGFHLGFQAQDNMESPPKNIFAEVFRSEGGDTMVTFCDIMDPSSPNVRKGCDECSRTVLHPKNVEFYNFPPTEAFRKSVTC